MSLRLGAGGACAAALWLCASSGAAATPTLVGVPSPITPLTGHPPVGSPDATVPGRFPRGRVTSRTRVLAEVDASGAPTAVSAVQRLTIHGVGDYFFAIPAPLRDVLPGPGTQAEPGLRPGMVLWQGFSGGRRVLSARLVLEPAGVTASLPLRLRLSRTGSRVTLELTNTTTISVSSFTAVAAPVDARRYLAALDRFAAGGPAPYPYLNAKDVRARLRMVTAPLRVTGTLLFPAGRTEHVDLMLGSGSRTVRIATASPGLPKVALVAHLVPLTRATSAHSTFDDLMERSLRLARTRQYEAFVANPAVVGTSSTTYVFHTAAPRSAPPPRADRGNDSPLPEALVACVLALGLVAGLVVWAHS